MSKNQSVLIKSENNFEQNRKEILMSSLQFFWYWNSIYHKFRSGCDEGVFENILQSFVDNYRKYYLVEMDSTFCKVHQHAAGAIKILENQNIGV